MTCSLDGTMRLWDLNDYSVKLRCGYSGNAIPTCSYLSDEIILSGWSDGKIRSYILEDGSPLWTLDNAHKDGVTTVELSHN